MKYYNCTFADLFATRGRKRKKYKTSSKHFCVYVALSRITTEYKF